jgi:large subunit ribosomal protein L24
MRQTVFHVKKNDVVQVMAGSEKGKTGKVLRVNHKTGKVVVEKVNLVKRHKKSTGKDAGGIIEQEAPIAASNVLIYCEPAGRGVRTQVKVLDNGKKVRFNPKHNVQLDK